MYSYFTDNQIMSFWISAVIIVASILSFHFGKSKLSLLLLFLGSLSLGFFIANLDHFLIIWDEQYHALVAKNLLSNPLKPTLYSNPLLEYDYKYWPGNHIWLHKQPLFLWQIAASLKLFGFNELAVRIPSIILHAIAAILIFRIGKISNNTYVGFYGALFFSVAYYPLELVAGRYHTDHNDIAFLFYIAASFWAWFEYQNSNKSYWLVLIGIFSGCAVLVKWLIGLLIYPAWIISLAINNKKIWTSVRIYFPILISLAISVLIFMPWQFYIFHNFPIEANYEFQFNTKHFFTVVENHGGNFLYHFNALKVIYGSGDAVPILLLLGIFLLLKNSMSTVYRVAILSSILITYGFYTVAKTKMVSYCIIVSPFVFLGLGALIDSVVSFLKLKIGSKKFELVFRSIISIGISFFLLNLSKIQHYHTDWKPNDNFNRKAEIEEMRFIEKLAISLNNDSIVVFNANARLNGHIPVMFYTNHIAYDFIPTEEQIRQIRSKSYRIAIYANGRLPDYILHDSDIIKITL